MTTVKQPQDRKEKAAKPEAADPQATKQIVSAQLDVEAEDAGEEVAEPVLEIEVDGHAYTAYPARMVTDMDAVEALAEMQADDSPMTQAAGTLRMFRACMGPDYNRFKRDQIKLHGYCATEKMMEIMQLIGEAPGN